MGDVTRADTEERIALGLAMLAPEHLADLLSMLVPEDYGRADHAAIHRLYADMHRRGMPVDCMTVPREASRTGWDRYGGPQYVIEIADRIPSAARSLATVASAVKDAANRRRLLDVARAASEMALGAPARSVTDPGVTHEPTTAQEAIDATIAELSSVEVLRRDEWSHGAAAWIAEDEAHERGDAPPVWSTGIGPVDERLNGGLTAGKLYIIGGRPGWGKTAHMTQLTVGMALRSHDVGYYPMEVEPAEWQSRCISIMSGVPLSVVLRRNQPGIATTFDWESMLDARDRLSQLPVHAMDSAHVSLADVASSAKRLKARHGTVAIFVDYLQRMDHGRASRYDLAIGQTVVGLKNLARDLRIAVVCAVQLNRGVDGRRGKTDGADWLAYQGIPRASDVREAGQIEQEADAIWFPVHPVEETLELPGVTGSEAAIVWAKNRNGAPGIDRGWSWEGPTARYWPDAGRVVDDLLP